MIRGELTIRIKSLENGYTVEVPDMAEIKKREAKAKADAKGNSPCWPYYGDCTKTYAAKSPKEVLKLVEAGLSELPDAEYDTAFAEASANSK